MNPNKNYNKTAQELLERNRTQSIEHSSMKMRKQRRVYRAEHPTEIAAYKCMDGRLNLAVYTETPSGIIQPFRTMGGIFDLGDERLGKIVQEAIEYAEDKKRGYLPLCTYHFSKGDLHRGCKGHNYDTVEAVEHAKRLADQFRFMTLESVSPNKDQSIYPVVVGLETDLESLHIHSDDGEMVFV
jgi:hypothetical protein